MGQYTCGMRFRDRSANHMSVDDSICRSFMLRIWDELNRSMRL